VRMRQGAWHDLQKAQTPGQGHTMLGRTLAAAYPQATAQLRTGDTQGADVSPSDQHPLLLGVQVPTLNWYIKKSALPENIR
jgi:hypothetical protein